MIDRYKSMTIEEILMTPKPASLLYAWQQVGNNEDPEALVRGHINQDQVLTDLLLAFTGTVDSSNRGRYETLNRDSLAGFLDYEAARERIKAIASRATDSEMVRIAKRLDVAFEDGSK